jgi:hypothetical protein
MVNSRQAYILLRFVAFTLSAHPCLKIFLQIHHPVPDSHPRHLPKPVQGPLRDAQQSGRFIDREMVIGQDPHEQAT